MSGFCHRGLMGSLTIVLGAGVLGAGVLVGAAYAQDVIYVPTAPPPPRVETVPAPPPDRVETWQPGYWHWNGAEYVWTGGHYVSAPRRGAVWIPGRWEQHPRGWIYIQGHWG